MRELRPTVAAAALVAPALVALAFLGRDLAAAPVAWTTLLERTRAWADLYASGLLPVAWAAAALAAVVTIAIACRKLRLPTRRDGGAPTRGPGERAAP